MNSSIHGTANFGGSGTFNATLQGPLPKDRSQLLADMRGCKQSAGQSILDHGIAVRRAYVALIRHLRDGDDIDAWWRIPAWARNPELMERLPPDACMRSYQIWHDAGKPYARIVSEDGRTHFPGHAEASERIWRHLGGGEIEARLMGMDMLAHTMSPEEAADFGHLPEAPALLLTAIAEIHANAEMFGGRDSDSFKAKIKRLDKRGRIAIAAMLSSRGRANPLPIEATGKEDGRKHEPLRIDRLEAA